MSAPYERYMPGAVAFGVLTATGVVVTAALVAYASVTFSFVLAALAVVTLGLTLLGGYESVALAFGRVPPITWLARQSEHRSPLAWIAVVFCTQSFAGLLAGHFFWSSCPPAPFGP